MEIHVESAGHWCVAVHPYNHAGITLEFHEVCETQEACLAIVLLIASCEDVQQVQAAELTT
jgi:hypothetical protein